MKTARKLVSIIYALSSLILVGIIVMSVIYSFTKIGTNETSIGIIGGVDGPTAKIITGKLFGIGGIGFLLFPFSVLVFNILNLISVFSKRQISNTLLLIWAVLNLGLFLAVPSQSTAVVTYSLYRPIIDTVWMYLFGTILSLKNVFWVSSLSVIVLCILKITHIKGDSK